MDNATPRKVSVTLRSRRRKSGKEALYLDITIDGKRHTEYLNLFLNGGKGRKEAAEDKETMRHAEILKSKRLVELKEMQIGIQKPKESARILLYDYVDSIVKTKKGTTLQSWRNLRERLRLYHPDTDIFLDEIDVKWARGFREHLDKSTRFDIDKRKRVEALVPISEGTKALMWNKFCTIFNEAIKDEYITKNPTAKLESFEESYAPREFLTIEELKRLRQTPPPHKEVGDAFIFSCLTGLRWSDIVNLRWGNVSETDGHTRLVFTQQKTGGLEYLDINTQAAQVMGERRADDASVFTNLTTVQDARKYVTAWVRAAGIDKHITFHCGRHTFATMMLTLGVDLYTVSKLLGHKSVETTQVYAKIIDKKKQSAVDKIPEIL